MWTFGTWRLAAGCLLFRTGRCYEVHGGQKMTAVNIQGIDPSDQPCLDGDWVDLLPVVNDSQVDVEEESCCAGNQSAGELR